MIHDQSSYTRLSRDKLNNKYNYNVVENKNFVGSDEQIISLTVPSTLTLALTQRDIWPTSLNGHFTRSN